MPYMLFSKVKCPTCNGTGEQPVGVQGGSQPCQMCDATGRYTVSDIELQANHFYTHEILECTPIGELLALTEDQMKLFTVIIAAAIVDLSEGTKVRNWLLNVLFDEETDSHTNILALIEG